MESTPQALRDLLAQVDTANPAQVEEALQQLRRLRNLSQLVEEAAEALRRANRATALLASEAAEADHDRIAEAILNQVRRGAK